MTGKPIPSVGVTFGGWEEEPVGGVLISTIHFPPRPPRKPVTPAEPVRPASAPEPPGNKLGVALARALKRVREEALARQDAATLITLLEQSPPSDARRQAGPRRTSRSRRR